MGQLQVWLLSAKSRRISGEADIPPISFGLVIMWFLSAIASVRRFQFGSHVSTLTLLSLKIRLQIDERQTSYCLKRIFLCMKEPFKVYIQYVVSSTVYSKNYTI